MKRRIKRTVLILLITSVCISLIAFFCYRKVSNDASDYLYSDVQKIPATKTALLLGTSKMLKSGNENLYFTYRIQATLQLYKAGKIRYVIISGDHGREEYNESEDMKQALISGGIPEKVIFLDYAGFRTLDSVVRCKEIFGQDSITIVSQKFHNERAVCLAQHYGIHANAFNAKDVSAYYGFRTSVREYFARIKLYLDYLIGTEPKFLGEKINLPE